MYPIKVRQQGGSQLPQLPLEKSSLACTAEHREVLPFRELVPQDGGITEKALAFADTRHTVCEPGTFNQGGDEDQRI